jgi:hypothetical protein
MLRGRKEKGKEKGKKRGPFDLFVGLMDGRE